MSEQLPLVFDAIAARDEALARVSAHAGPSFAEQVRGVVSSMRGQQVTGEDIRFACAELGIVPHHHNAWGAVIRPLIGRVLFPTGERRKLRGRRSHARTTDVYEVSR